MLDNSSITEFNYRYSTKKDAHIFVGIKLSKGEGEKQALISRLSKSFEVIDMSDNSMAKTHIRYMVGAMQMLRMKSSTDLSSLRGQERF